MNLRERTRSFMNDTGVKATAFCGKIGISTTWLYLWLDGKYELSERHAEKVTAYLDAVYVKK